MKLPQLNIRLSHKIVAIGAIGIVGLVAIATIYMAGLRTQEHHRDVASQARAIAALTGKVAVAILETRRAEKDFLLRADETYVVRHADVTTTIRADLDALKRDSGAAGRSELVQKVEFIRTGFDAYAAHFAALADTRRKLGLNETSGLEGTLRKSVHAIETKLKDFDEPRLMVTMLMMRRHEKDFMLRRDPKYGDDIKKRVAEFTKYMAGTTIDAAAKDDIAQKLAAYQRDFFAWMEGAQAIAREQRAVNEAYAKIEPEIGALQQAVETLRHNGEAAETFSRDRTTRQMQIAIVVIVLAVGALAYVIGRSVSRPLAGMAVAMKELASGNFAVVLPGLGRKDEVGEMAQAIETFKVTAMERARREAEEEEAKARALEAERKAEMQRLADSFEQAVGGIVETVSSAASELESSARSLTNTAEATQQLSGMVAEASEVASANVQSVAAASEQLTAAVAEINRQVEEARKIAGAAVHQANATDARIGELSTAASRIGDVVKLITAIAEQTNLLALNATIEAARAGEAGRGFAVVASEVKTLASQTAKATDEISAQIAGMQNATRDSVVAIKEIGATIDRISQISTSISGAVGQQGAATQEIARNVVGAAQSTQQVADNIGDVNRGAGETGTASAQVLASARSLADEGTRLRLEVDRFLATVRAA
jgi:methyl-accepting chemotaxis protein